jgi:hypothetical protein
MLQHWARYTLRELKGDCIFTSSTLEIEKFYYQASVVARRLDWVKMRNVAIATFLIFRFYLETRDILGEYNIKCKIVY